MLRLQTHIFMWRELVKNAGNTLEQLSLPPSYAFILLLICISGIIGCLLYRVYMAGREW